MTIRLDEKTIGIWYIKLSPGSDYLASMRDDGDGKMRLDYRFRYYKDANAFDSEDEKSWYTGTTKSTREEALESIRRIISVMETISGNRGAELLIENGDVQKFLVELRKQPWAHTKTEPLH